MWDFGAATRAEAPAQNHQLAAAPLKSVLVSVALVAWLRGHDPSLKIIVLTFLSGRNVTSQDPGSRTQAAVHFAGAAERSRSEARYYLPVFSADQPQQNG